MKAYRNEFRMQLEASRGIAIANEDLDAPYPVGWIAKCFELHPDTYGGATCRRSRYSTTVARKMKFFFCLKAPSA